MATDRKLHLQATVKKVHQSKIYEYIRKIEIDGLPRIRAYAEAIDDKIYDLPAGAAHRKLDRVREDYPEYNELRELVLAEQKDWAMRRAHVVQDKAVDLLVSSIDAALAMVKKEDVNAKDLTAATGVLKSLLPALNTAQSQATMNTKDYTARAEKFIN